MLGVALTRDPYALIACAAWSSDMMKRMLGRSAAGAGACIAKADRKRVRIATRMGGFYSARAGTGALAAIGIQ